MCHDAAQQKREQEGEPPGSAEPIGSAELEAQPTHFHLSRDTGLHTPLTNSL